MPPLIKASELAKALGISRYTVRDWCRRDPTLSVRVKGENWVRLDILATRPGMDIIRSIVLGDQKWIKAVDLARLAKIPRRTVAYWCQKRPWFACRIGRNWYVNPELLGASQEEAEMLVKLSELSKKKEQ